MVGLPSFVRWHLLSLDHKTEVRKHIKESILPSHSYDPSTNPLRISGVSCWSD